MRREMIFPDEIGGCKCLRVEVGTHRDDGIPIAYVMGRDKNSRKWAHHIGRLALRDLYPRSGKAKPC